MARAGLGHFEEAESMLLESYDMLKGIPYAYYAGEGEAALERLIKLYELWGRQEEVEEWCSDLDDLRKSIRDDPIKNHVVH